jgi:hypothetical protein
MLDLIHSAKCLRCIILVVTTLELSLGMFCDVNKVNELMYVTS